ncbi:MAG TPA: alpha-L-arabinofuranosidase C-terminal domain-containing protein [Puia sp.]|nr:alpha-L-arabinofuranosidase C-terminal domain-containing protein [Puia sp.]
MPARITYSLFLAILLLSTGNLDGQNPVTLLLSPDQKEVVISKNIYGHFSEHLGRCIYDGYWVDSALSVPKKDRIRLDIVEALKKINLPLLRWPGGCFADEYHWRDGIGPANMRPKRVNTNWGMVTEDNSFGTHEFLELCDLIGCEPYIAGNVGTGTPQEMANWIEYLNFQGKSELSDLRKQNGHEKAYQVSFWGVGNESWGCGGNMTPEFYADQYKRYAGFCKNYPGTNLKKIASGSNVDDYNWTEVCMKKIPAWEMWGISLHYYTVANDWSHKGSATKFGEDEYFKAVQKSMYMDELVQKHSAIMDKYDPDKKISLCVDEWGIWTDVEPGTNPAFLYQQNSMRDAIIAATTLNIFNNHCDRVRLACLAQTINVLQSLILTDKEKMVLTPTYHVFDLYKVHQDATKLSVQFSSPDYIYGNNKIPAVNASASKDKKGLVHISLVNVDPRQSIRIIIPVSGFSGKSIRGEILHSGNFTDFNSFERPDLVKPSQYDGFKKEGNHISMLLPPLSIVVLEIN